MIKKNNLFDSENVEEQKIETVENNQVTKKRSLSLGEIYSRELSSFYKLRSKLLQLTDPRMAEDDKNN